MRFRLLIRVSGPTWLREVMMVLERLAATALIMFIAGTAVAQTEWVPYEGNPVVPGVAADEWPGLVRYIEAVVVVHGTYHMFFTGTAVDFGADHEIGHATSPDGITWSMDPQNPVMTPEDEGDWDVDSYISLAVIHDGTQFRMWYGGCETNAVCKVGMATSPDGSAWTRYSENPVFEAGPVGSFDQAVVMPGTVIRRGGLYHMWYGAAEVPTLFTTYTIGYATSSDGVTWVRHPSAVLEPGPSSWDGYQVFSPGVIFDGVSYHMWYTGAWRNGTYLGFQIGYATSPDGISWTKDPANPIDVLGGSTEQPRVLLHAYSHECEMFYNNPTNLEFSVNRATSSCQAYCQTRHPTRRTMPVGAGVDGLAPEIK